MLLYLFVLVHDFFVLSVDLLHLVLEIFDDVLKVGLGIADTLSVIFYEL